MEKSSNIDVREITLEAEEGHGHYLKSVLAQLSFEEQLHIAQQMAHLSKDDSRAFGFPEVEFSTENGWSDDNSKNGYINLKLTRKIPGAFGPLSDKEDLLYQSSLNLTTGNKTAIENDLYYR